MRYSGPRPDAPAVPLTVHRPDTPPVPPDSASDRLVRRYLPGSATVRPFTVFDAHYGHRTFYCHGFATYPDRLRIAVDASPSLGLSPRYAWLDCEVEGLPTPQLVLQAAHIPVGLWTFPLDLRSFGGHICVLVADRQSSAFEFVARATDTCRLQGRVTAMHMEGSVVLEVDKHVVASDASRILKFASITKLRKSQRWGDSSIFRRHGATAAMLPERDSPVGLPATSDVSSDPGDLSGADVYYPLDPDRFPPSEACTILVHAVGIQPIVLTVPFAASTDDICELATAAVVAVLPEATSHGSRWRPCQTSPVGEHLMHSVFVHGCPEDRDECHVILDLRATGLPGPDYHAVIFPVAMSVEFLFRLVTNFLGGHRPKAIFQGLTQVSGYFCVLSTGQMLRPIVSSSAVGLRAVQPPAMWRAAQCFQVLPGLRLTFTNALASVMVGSSHALDAPVCPGHANAGPGISGQNRADDSFPTTTTTQAHTFSTTTTSSVTVPLCTNPFVGLHHLDFVMHLSGPEACTAHVTQSGRGHTAEVLTELLWCLRRRDLLPDSCTLLACPRIFFDDHNRAHVFVSARATGAGRYFWLFAPGLQSQPVCLPWRDQIEIPDILDHLPLQGAETLQISINGELCREHPVFAAPGCVVKVSDGPHSHFTLPLHMLRGRCIGIQSLHFRARGPTALQSASRRDLRQFCDYVVAHARELLGERSTGNSFVVAGMHTPPLVCCAGTPLPPTLSQVQQYYDSRLQRHFGAMVLRDTACVQYDYTLFVQRQNSVQRRIWLWPL